MTTDKVMCTARRCGWNGTEDQMLVALNPFDSAETLNGCPKCRGVDTIVVACDEPGCWNETSCGTPTPTGYRRTCPEHAPRHYTIKDTP